MSPPASRQNARTTTECDRHWFRLRLLGHLDAMGTMTMPANRIERLDHLFYELLTN
ncbi:hypothetical protein DPMN_084452 [Dreissena polymorpha]|uniref:Uncharacterized protein n=1 Tax=Dreissena polymorpha TaxID=45954 RepID=A0A9D4BKW2_DREPO|nr:hypothetical protein DPMN_084452 [Dreissena polymorpha]